MKFSINDAIDVEDLVWEWTEIHPEAKKYFRITYEYVPDLQALRLTMERAYPDETKYGIVRILPEDILGNMVCPSDYINAALEEMYKKLMESEETERQKLRDYVAPYKLSLCTSYCICRLYGHTVLGRFQKGILGSCNAYRSLI